MEVQNSIKEIKNPNVDIKTDGKTEYFRKPKTEQTVAITNDICFAEKYLEVD